MDIFQESLFIRAVNVIAQSEMISSNTVFYSGLVLTFIAFAIIYMRAANTQNDYNIKISYKDLTYEGSFINFLFLFGILSVVLSFFIAHPSDTTPRSNDNTDQAGKNANISTQCSRAKATADDGESIRDDNIILFLTATSFRKRIEAEKAPGSDWAYYGRIADGIWDGQYFSSGSGPNGRPVAGDRLTAITNINIRTGPQERSIRNYINNPRTRIACAGEVYSVTFVLELSVGYIWIKLK